MIKRAGDFFDQINPWWQAPSFRYQFYDRKTYTEPLLSKKDRLIKILLGGRRVGKTSILQTTINRLLNDGINPKSIIFLTADLRQVKEQGIQNTLENLLPRLGSKQTGLKHSENLHIFIDEIQEIPNWQIEIKLLYDTSNYRVYVTGSSSLLLSKQTSKLTGRYRLRHVLPLSFREFLMFKGIGENSNKSLLENTLDEYLRIGGYPEYVLNNDPTYLRQCVESTLYRELMTAYGMRNPALLQDLIYFLADKMTNDISVKRISKDLKIDDKTAQFYLRYLRDVYLIYPVYRAGKSNRITKGSNPKYYFNDTGVLALTARSFRIGHASENAVFLKLLRQQSFYEQSRIEYTIINGQEVDFVTNGEVYEVKAIGEISSDVLEKFSNLDCTVSMIIHGDTKKVENYSTRLRPIALREFLLGEIDK